MIKYLHILIRLCQSAISASHWVFLINPECEKNREACIDGDCGNVYLALTLEFMPASKLQYRKNYEVETHCDDSRFIPNSFFFADSLIIYILPNPEKMAH